MNKFKKFSSIVQFSGVVKCVRDYCKYNNIPVPTLNFSGSTKIHGSNAAVGFKPTGEVWFQSRERVLDITQDNAGFCLWGEHNVDKLKEFYKELCSFYNFEHDNVYIYGEWFGSSIQKGVAVTQLNEKRFGVFKIVFVTQDAADPEKFKEVEIDGTEWNSVFFNCGLNNVFVIDSIVPPIELEINFNEPHLVQNKLLELTLSVEQECPVGKYFGVTGIGEGIVWSTTDVDWLPKFKTKGELHSVSKVTTVRELTSAEIASKNSAAEFVEFACTQNRLEQGIDKLKEMGLPIEIKSMGAFLKWVGGDILKECHDVLVVSYIDKKDVMGPINNKAKTWFMNYLNSEIGLAA